MERQNGQNTRIAERGTSLAQSAKLLVGQVEGLRAEVSVQLALAQSQRLMRLLWLRLSESSGITQIWTSLDAILKGNLWVWLTMRVCAAKHNKDSHQPNI